MNSNIIDPSGSLEQLEVVVQAIQLMTVQEKLQLILRFGPRNFDKLAELVREIMS